MTSEAPERVQLVRVRQKEELFEEWLKEYGTRRYGERVSFTEFCRKREEARDDDANV